MAIQHVGEFGQNLVNEYRLNGLVLQLIIIVIATFPIELNSYHYAHETMEE